MRVPFHYSVRNLRARWRSSLLMAGGIGLAVVVYVSVMALADGLARTFVETGRVDNLIVVGDGAVSMSYSSIGEETAAAVRDLPQVRSNAAGQPLVSPELLATYALARPTASGAPRGAPQNVAVPVCDSCDRRPAARGEVTAAVRGVDPIAFQVHRGVRLAEGEPPGNGGRVAMSRRLARTLGAASLGTTLHFGRSEWTLVGFLESDGNAYESEIWADRHDLMRDRMREDFTHVVANVEAGDLEAARATMNAWEADPRLGVTVYNEYLYYRYLSRAGQRIRTACLGMLVAMVLAAVLGGFNTLHASLVTRLREMGLLAALGFRRREVLLAFLTESQVIALLGGLAGTAAALTLQGMSMKYAGTNVSFHVGPDLLLQGLGLALLVGFLGGWLPARAAARRTAAESLRAI